MESKRNSVEPKEEDMTLNHLEQGDDISAFNSFEQCKFNATLTFHLEIQSWLSRLSQGDSEKCIHYNEETQRFLTYVQNMAKVFNKQAMKQLNIGKNSKSHLLLSMLMLCLDTLQEKFPQVNFKGLQSLTLNNMSCIFKQAGKILSAQECLMRAKDLNDLHSEMQDIDTKSLTALNLCAIFSAKKQHLQAKKQALKAIDSLRHDIAMKGNGIKGERLDLLQIAYYNLGCEQEYLAEYASSLKSYTHAWNLEKQKTSSNMQETIMSNQFKKCIKLVKQKMNSAKPAERSRSVGKKNSFTNLNKIIKYTRLFKHHKNPTSFEKYPQDSLFVHRTHRNQKDQASTEKTTVTSPRTSKRRLVGKNRDLKTVTRDESAKRLPSRNQLQSVPLSR